MVSVYLSNSTLVAAVGSAGGKRPRLRKLCASQELTGCMVGGIITDADAFRDALKRFWAANKLPRRGLVLNIDSAQFITRIMEVPSMSDKRTLEYIHMDLASVERAADPVYSWYTLGRNSQTGIRRLFVIMAESGFLRTYMELFHELGLQVKTVCPAIWGAIRLLRRSRELAGKNGLVQLADDMNVTSILFEQGEYVYSTKKRMFNEVESDMYGEEFAQNVSNTLQFVRAQHAEIALTKIYVEGVPDLDALRPDVEPLNVELERLNLEKLIGPSKGAGGYEVVCAVGGLLKAAAGRTLLAGYQVQRKAAKPKNKLVGRIVPLALGLLVMVGLAVWQYTIRAERQQALAELEAFMQSTDTAQKQEQYNTLLGELSRAASIRSGYETAVTDMDTYPVVDSVINQTLENCAGDIAQVIIHSYDANSGVLQFDAKTTAAENINAFIALLDQQQIFQSVSYSGYTYQSDSRTWSIQVICCLAEQAKEEAP